jgi:hypothetical protein
MTRDEWRAVNDKHSADPQPGDYWHEMFMPVLLVLGRIAGRVLVCDKTKSVTSHTWTWDFEGEGVKLLTLEQFRQRLTYSGIPGYPSDTPGYWADVAPERHIGAVRYFEEAAAVQDKANAK